MLFALLIACGTSKDGYDLETWRSPLAAQYDGEGDAAEGERIYFEEHWEDASAYGFTCDSCHSIDPGDTLLVDAGEFTRPGHTTWNAPYRELWKSNQAWDDTESTVIGAYGGQVCVAAYFPSGSAMTPEQAAHLEAYMRTRMDADPAGDPRAEPLDYGFTSWDTKAEFVASVADGDGWLYGTELGDPTAGEALAARQCGSCHLPDGASAPEFASTGTLELPTLIARIRRANLDDGTDAPNVRMPRISEDRLPDADLADLLAYLTVGREAE